MTTFIPRPERRPWSWPLYVRRCVGCGVKVTTPAPNRGKGKEPLLCPACKIRRDAGKGER